jgi:DNA-binding beta-propeller fold protein YncE
MYRQAGIAAVIALAIFALGIAFQACGDEGAASVIEPPRVAVAGSPRAIAVGEGAIWVTRYDDGKVSRIDESSDTQSIDVGPHPNQIVTGEGSVWVSADDGKKLVQIDPRTNKVVKRVSVDFGACDCTIGEMGIVGDTLWVGVARRDGILKFERSTGEQFPTPYKPGPGFEGVFVAREDYLWAIGNYDLDPAISWVIQVEPISGLVRSTHLRSNSFLDGIAYGEGKVWIADAGNSQNVVTAFNPSTKSVDADIDLGTRITTGDIAFAEGSVLVWDPVEGQLTRIDADDLQVEETQQIRGYKTGQSVNRKWSELAVQGNVAWVTDPAADAVYEIEY